MRPSAGLITSVRIFVSYGAGLALLYLLNAAIWLQRPDIVDRENRVRNIATEYISRAKTLASSICSLFWYMFSTFASRISLGTNRLLNKNDTGFPRFFREQYLFISCLPRAIWTRSWSSFILFVLILNMTNAFTIAMSIK